MKKRNRSRIRHATIKRAQRQESAESLDAALKLFRAMSSTSADAARGLSALGKAFYQLKP